MKLQGGSYPFSLKAAFPQTLHYSTQTKIFFNQEKCSWFKKKKKIKILRTLFLIFRKVDFNTFLIFITERSDTQGI